MNINKRKTIIKLLIWQIILSAILVFGMFSYCLGQLILYFQGKASQYDLLLILGPLAGLFLFISSLVFAIISLVSFVHIRCEEELRKPLGFCIASGVLCLIGVFAIIAAVNMKNRLFDQLYFTTNTYQKINFQSNYTDDSYVDSSIDEDLDDKKKELTYEERRQRALEAGWDEEEMFLEEFEDYFL